LPSRVSVAFPVPLRRTFVYAVPPALAGLARSGARVRAPLGSRTLSGVVVEEEPAAPSGLEPRPLVDVLDEEPALSRELLESTRRVAERFFAPWGELLRAALPAGLPGAEATAYAMTAPGAAAISTAAPEERAALERLLAAGRMSGSQLRSETGSSADTLRELEIRGWIRALSGGRPSVRRTETVYAARPAEESVVTRATGRSRRAREAYAFLRALGRAATGEEARHAGFSSAVLSRLVGSGLATAWEQERRPDPAAAAPEIGPSGPFRLTAPQESALKRICESIEGRRFRVSLLFGVTGSGKTEIYLRAIERALAAGRGAVWLVPEIALTPVFARSLQGRFGEAAAVLHSALGSSRRARAWEAMRRGQARVVIGPRSAVFAPIPDIGLFVVDEEHDSSYKQDESPRYDARDAAALRAQAHEAAVVLGSATPSMESLAAARDGRIDLLELRERIERRPLPDVFVVDLKVEEARPEEKGTPLFSTVLVARLSEVFARGEQAILLVPRRGYAPFLLCRDCGHDFRCDRCSVARAVHRRERALLCHYCGGRRALPVRCERCGGRLLEAIGAGTERAAERFEEIFPGVRYAVLDSDTVRRQGAAAGVVASMESGDVSALIGTQMVAKGHHFPGVTAIGILSADTILNFPDFRAGEKTFQLLAQAGGRSGRGDRPGTVHVQTFHPESPAVRRAVAHDVEGFCNDELEFRRAFFYPPFSEMAEVLVSSPSRDRGESVAREVAERLAGDPDVKVSGPEPAPLERLLGKWRFQILLRSRSRRAVLRRLEEGVPEPAPAGVHLAVDVDPRNLM
jgi:primosomal protein N' (replication factor Y)